MSLNTTNGSKEKPNIVLMWKS